ncbi:NAD(P)/FAD-dependent oxidoreductase [Nocardia shimofusensis]|uniref:NAD(P)/FAD-dependent oxidoreductase n=1 Tax=Nocardia shimofusensis TaxID=228596 RepID=UPI00082A422E|nr:FAD-dependent oxidoreductase [Nocardia shimofusensis]
MTASTRRTGVLVIGAGAAGLATVEALRRAGYREPITLLGAEAHLPYDRPPLSKQILTGAWRAEQTMLRPPRMLHDLDARIVLAATALSLDADTRTARTTAGSWQADHIVIATGAAPRALPGVATPGGVHMLRTLDDALDLREATRRCTRVAVVGEGVLGAEIAATTAQLSTGCARSGPGQPLGDRQPAALARSADLGRAAEVAGEPEAGPAVTMIGPLRAPMVTQLGDFVADRLAELHVRHGVELCLGTGVQGFTERGGRVTGVTVSTGDVVPADLVVVAIGATPATGWLDSSGLRLDNGIVCDCACRAAAGIYAVGDVARWQHPDTGSSVRLENRTNATEQASVVAAAILGGEPVYRPIPYFWTDQLGVKIQVFGTVTPDAEAVVVEGDPADNRFVVRYETAGVVTAVLGWNMPKQARLHRQRLVEAAAARQASAAQTAAGSRP